MQVLIKNQNVIHFEAPFGALGELKSLVAQNIEISSLISDRHLIVMNELMKEVDRRRQASGEHSIGYFTTMEVEMTSRQASFLYEEVIGLMNILRDERIFTEAFTTLSAMHTALKSELHRFYKGADLPTNGLDRCECGCKYWAAIYCLDCGDKFRRPFEEDNRSAVDVLLGVKN
jgi:hypothetical protein